MTNSTRNHKDMSLAFFSDEQTINVNAWVKKNSQGQPIVSEKGSHLMTGSISFGPNERIYCNFWCNPESGMVVAKATERVEVTNNNEKSFEVKEVQNVPPVGFFQVPAGLTNSQNPRLYLRGAVTPTIGEAPQTILTKLSNGDEIPLAGYIESNNEQDKENTKAFFKPVIDRCMKDPVAFKESLKKDKGDNQKSADAGQKAPESSTPASEPQQQAPQESNNDGFDDLQI